MKNLKKIITLSLLTLILGAQMLVVPMVMAQTPSTKGATPAAKTATSTEKLQALNETKAKVVAEEKINLGEDMTVEIKEQGGNCLNDKEKQNYIYTVLETPLAISSDIAQSKIVSAEGHQVEQIDNGNGTLTRRCFRFTQILTLPITGSEPEVVTDTYLIAGVIQPDNEQILGCPVLPENRSYGETIAGRYYDCQEVTVVMSRLEQGGIGFLNAYVSLIYKWVAGIIGIIAVLIMVISGLQIITAQGEPSAVEEAKKRIFQSIGGVLLLFFASALLYMINPTFFNPPTYSDGSGTNNSAPAP